MIFALVVEAVLGFVVASADSVGEETPRPVRHRVARAILWPVTIWVWFTHRAVPKLTRFGAIIWLFLTAGWLLALQRDRLSTAVFIAVAEATLAFVVYCVDTMSADLQHQPLRRLARSLFWPKAIAEYLGETDSVKLVQASVTVWILLTSGWFIALMVDRVGRPLGWI